MRHRPRPPTSTAECPINAPAVFAEVVGLPAVRGQGATVQCLVTGDHVSFRSCVIPGYKVDPMACALAVANAVKAEAERVGAVALIQLTALSVMPLSPTIEQLIRGEGVRAEAYWDGMFLLADGRLHAPDLGGVWVDDTCLPPEPNPIRTFTADELVEQLGQAVVQVDRRRLVVVPTATSHTEVVIDIDTREARQLTWKRALELKLPQDHEDYTAFAGFLWENGTEWKPLEEAV